MHLGVFVCPAQKDADPILPEWLVALQQSAACRLSFVENGSADVPVGVQALLLLHPQFSGQLADLVTDARLRRVPVIGAYNSMDFDLEIWPVSPLRHNPMAPLGGTHSQNCALARSLALCDHFLATGQTMARRLQAWVPTAGIGILPPVLPVIDATIERKNGRSARLMFLPATQTERMMLASQARPILATLARTGAELIVSAETYLPPELEKHNRISRAPSARTFQDRMTLFAAADVAIVPQDPSDWSRGGEALSLLPALALGVACSGGLADQITLSQKSPRALLFPAQKVWQDSVKAALRHARWPGPQRRMAQRALDDWRDHHLPPNALPRITAELRRLIELGPRS